MTEQLDPGEAPAADGGCGGTTILAKRPFTFSYVSPVFAVSCRRHDHSRGEEEKESTK